MSALGHYNYALHSHVASEKLDLQSNHSLANPYHGKDTAKDERSLIWSCVKTQ